MYIYIDIYIYIYIYIYDRDARFVCALRRKLMLIGCNHVTIYEAEQLSQRLCVAARTLPPRCMYAEVRTIMNAWCTAARLGGDKDCVFCGAISCDRIQHVRQCPAVCDALYASLASPFSLPEVLSFNNVFLLGCTNPAKMLRGIMILDMLYRACNAARTARYDRTPSGSGTRSMRVCALWRYTRLMLGF